MYLVSQPKERVCTVLRRYDTGESPIRISRSDPQPFGTRYRGKQEGNLLRENTISVRADRRIALIGILRGNVQETRTFSEYGRCVPFVFNWTRRQTKRRSLPLILLHQQPLSVWVCRYPPTTTFTNVQFRCSKSSIPTVV